jgi:hypothetical protein
LDERRPPARLRRAAELGRTEKKIGAADLDRKGGKLRTSTLHMRPVYRFGESKKIKDAFVPFVSIGGGPFVDERVFY